MLVWHKHQPTRVGIFCVKKKSGPDGKPRQRLIFDSRIANTDFETPELSRLPPGSFADSDCPSPVHLSQGDIQNACYTIGIDSELAKQFAMPPIIASDIGISHSVEGYAFDPDERIGLCSGSLRRVGAGASPFAKASCASLAGALAFHTLKMGWRQACCHAIVWAFTNQARSLC
jgi:hypothetical protein